MDCPWGQLQWEWSRPNKCRRGWSRPTFSANFDWRRPPGASECRNALAPTCTNSAPSSLTPTSGVRFTISFVQRPDLTLVLIKGHIWQKIQYQPPDCAGKERKYTYNQKEKHLPSSTSVWIMWEIGWEIVIYSNTYTICWTILMCPSNNQSKPL